MQVTAQDMRLMKAELMSKAYIPPKSKRPKTKLVK
jgi:hypothetical protein